MAVQNLKIRVVPVESMKAVADSLAAGNDVKVDFSRFRLKVELEAGIEDIQAITEFVRKVGSEKGV